MKEPDAEPVGDGMQTNDGDTAGGIKSDGGDNDGGKSDVNTAHDISGGASDADNTTPLDTQSGKRKIESKPPSCQPPKRLCIGTHTPPEMGDATTSTSSSNLPICSHISNNMWKQKKQSSFKEVCWETVKPGWMSKMHELIKVHPAEPDGGNYRTGFALCHLPSVEVLAAD